MKKLVLGVTGIFLLNSQLLFSAEVGDKIQLTKFNVLCKKYSPNHAKFWFINLLKKGDTSYIEKVSNGICFPLSGLSINDKMIGKVVKKRYQSLSKKDFDALAKKMKFEILKIDLLSLKGKKIKSDTQVFWYAFPKDLQSYKVIK